MNTKYVIVIFCLAVISVGYLFVHKKRNSINQDKIEIGTPEEVSERGFVNTVGEI